MKRPQFILHGGAISQREHVSAAAIAFMRECCARAYARLREGAEAVEVVCSAVRELEESGLYLAGKGAHPNELGAFELDASIMNGADASAGGVAGVAGARYAIGLAERARRGGKAVLLAGAGAKLAFPDDPSWLSPTEDYFRPMELASGAAGGSGLSTVGAAAADLNGDCAAATATGGVIGKPAGRIGDTALIGAGVWADANVAISCTGQGEYFIRTAAARSVAARIALAGESLGDALDATIAEVNALGGIGGIVAATRHAVHWSLNAAGLKRAWVDADGAVQASF